MKKYKQLSGPGRCVCHWLNLTTQLFSKELIISSFVQKFWEFCSLSCFVVNSAVKNEFLAWIFSPTVKSHTLLPARDNMSVLIHVISTSPVLLGTIFWFQRVQCFHFRHNFFLQRLNDALITFIWFFCKENYWVNFGHAPARGHRDVIQDIIRWFKRWNALSTKKRFFKNFLWYANRIYLIFLQGIIGLCTHRQKVIVKWLPRHGKHWKKSCLQFFGS